MKLKLIIAAAALLAMPAVAHAQAGKAAPKVTKADAQKVVQIITADKAKLAAYCSLAKLGEQMDQAEQKKDQKKAEDLGKQMEAIGQKLGPEYANLMAGLEGLDENSQAGKDIQAAFEALDKQCPK
jgi:parvulin-like peptidyl-prolyl isomerase